VSRGSASFLDSPRSGSDRGGNLSVRLGAGSSYLELRFFGEFRGDFGRGGKIWLSSGTGSRF
jgi:hypothetical protein